jgi:hypothetical protein
MEIPSPHYAGRPGGVPASSGVCLPASRDLSTAAERIWVKANPVHSHIMQDDLAVFQPAAEYVPLLDKVYERLQREVASVPGAFVEHNKFSVTVHFRRVAEQVSEAVFFCGLLIKACLA